MQAIVTKFVPPNPNDMDQYVDVKAYAGKMRVPWADNLGIEENHDNAAREFCKKYGWGGTALYRGTLPDGSYVYVFGAKSVQVDL